MTSASVLSFTTDGSALAARELALQRAGFEVVSVTSEARAHFEIEMGQCGVLLLCSRVADAARAELTKLFRQNCPDGIIVFVWKYASEAEVVDADVCVPEADGPDAIVRALQGHARTLPKVS